MKFLAACTAISLTLVLLVTGCDSGPSDFVPHPSALSATRSSPAIRPAPVAISRKESWSFIEPGGSILSTPHFRIFTTAKSGVILDRLPNFTESSLARYSTSITALPAPARQLDTYFLATRPQWARMTQSLMGPEAEKLLRIQRGGFAHQGQGVFFDIGPRDTFALMAHEGWHQYTQSTFRQPLPVWLEEGIATTMEGFRWDDTNLDVPVFLPWANLERFDMLRSAHTSKRLISLHRLFATTPQEELSVSQDGTLIYYSQVWALSLFLIEGENGKYRPGLEQLLKDAAAGTVFAKIARSLGTQAAQSTLLRRRGPEIFMSYFSKNISAVETEYQDFIARVTAVGAKERIVRGESPLR